MAALWAAVRLDVVGVISGAWVGVGLAVITGALVGVAVLLAVYPRAERDLQGAAERVEQAS